MCRMMSGLGVGAAGERSVGTRSSTVRYATWTGVSGLTMRMRDGWAEVGARLEGSDKAIS